MSDSINISFVRAANRKLGFNREESVVIYSSNKGGMTLVSLASSLIGVLPGPDGWDPVSRREPDALIAPFFELLNFELLNLRYLDDIRVLHKPIVNAALGHWQIDVYTGKAKKVREPK